MLTRATAKVVIAAAVLLATVLAACSTNNRQLSVSGATPAGPPHRLEVRDGRWSLVAPDGRPYFSLGVSCADKGVLPEDYDPENPAYAWWQHYPDRHAWCEATVARLRRWGITTVGGWGDFDAIRAEFPAPITGSAAGPLFMPVLHIGSTVGAPWLDMWDRKLLDRMDKVAREQIVRLRDDPRVVGYYSDNELGWWNATLFKMTIEQPPASGQRRRLVALLREHYRGDWAALRRDFFARDAESWPALECGGVLHPRPGRAATPVMRRFLALMADRYYRLMRDTIRRYDRRALILGDRYQSFYYPEVVRAAAPYVDAVSTNLNAAWNDGTFPRFYLDTLHRLTGKPVIVSEFYMAAGENRTGNRNTRGVYPVVATQAERARAARATLDAVARLPYVVGAEWFQYYDEPRHGRSDGENFNFGLIDVNDMPYEGLTNVFATFDPAAVRAPTRDATQGVPRAPADPFADFKPTLALKCWDRERGFVPSSSELPVADLYVCWSPRAIYLGVYCLDVVEKSFYRDGRMPKEDRMLWTVKVNGPGGPIRARLGADREPVISDATLRVANLSGLDLNVRNVAVLELPARLFGKSVLETSDRVTISSELSTHCQAYETRWTATLTLAR